MGVGPRLMRLDVETPRGGIGQGRLVIVGPPPPEGGVRSAMQTGVRGYLFGGALRRTVALPWVDNVGAAATVRRTVTVADEKGVPRELSHREVEILRHAADGQSNLAIAATLNLSPLTVKSHLGRIGRRLGSGDRARLVYLALRAGAVV